VFVEAEPALGFIPESLGLVSFLRTEYRFMQG
jgi:hypothetical protein